MEKLIIKFDQFGEIADYDVKGGTLYVLGAAIACELKNFLEFIWEEIYKKGSTKTGGNVTNVDIDNNIVHISLNPHVFGQNIGVFETDLVQFKYLLGMLIHLKKNGARTILITRKDGKITVEEASVEAVAS